MKKTILSLFFILSSLSAFAQVESESSCGLGYRYIVSRTENLADRLIAKIQKCIRNNLDEKWYYEYAARELHDSDGHYVYFTDNHREVFSTRELTAEDGEYFYFRDSNRKDFLSFRAFLSQGEKYFYLRDSNRADFFSIKYISDSDGDYIYFRNKSRSDFLSIRILKDGADQYIYFRDASRNDIISVHNGRIFRGANRSSISLKEFNEAFQDKFWKPIELSFNAQSNYPAR